MTKGKESYEKVFTKLAKIVGDNRVKKFSKAPNKIVVRPKTNDHVSDIVRLALKEGIAIVPKREMFWHVEDVTPDKNRIILDTSEMNGIFEIDEENLIVSVGPGVIWKDLYEILYQKGYFIGVYPWSSKSTVGEWIDLGGAGIGSYTYGFAGDLVRTMEIVLPDGKIINTGFEKVLSNSSGYNLNGLFVGADSTLGVITKITLKMFPAPEETRPLSYSFNEMKGMTGAIHELTRLKTTPMNVSFYGRNHLKSLQLFGKEVPYIEGIMLNIALAGLKSVVDYDEKVIDSIMAKHGAKKETSEIAGKLWEERYFDAPSNTDVRPVLSETLIPAKNLLEMIKDTCSYMNEKNLEGAVMGILCDRSTIALTSYYLSKKKDTKNLKFIASFAEKIAELALRYDGRPAGSSLFFASDLKRFYGEGINTILDIKSTLDPHEIMNPDRLT
jgi:FAD/FMN-containing dehydrogenase